MTFTQLPAKSISYSPDLSTWVSIKVSSNTSPGSLLAKANWSTCEWTVSERGQHPNVTLHIDPNHFSAPLPFKIPKSWGERSVSKVDNGWLVAFDRGECGGDVWWYSLDGKKHYKISNDEVAGFLSNRNGLLALAGLAHLGYSNGKIIHVVQKSGRWCVATLAALGDAPRTAALDEDDSLIVVGATKIFRVGSTGRVDILAKKIIFSDLYPNSMVRIHAGDFYVGMRGFVIRLSVAKEKVRIDWLLPQKNFLKTAPSLGGVKAI